MRDPRCYVVTQAVSAALLVLLFDFLMIYGWICTFRGDNSTKIVGSIIMSVVTISAISLHVNIAGICRQEEPTEAQPLVDPADISSV